MKRTNITDVKGHRNDPVARVVAVRRRTVANRTKLGCGVGTGEILADVTGPAFSLGAWQTLKGKGRRVGVDCGDRACHTECPNVSQNPHGPSS